MRTLRRDRDSRDRACGLFRPRTLLAVAELTTAQFLVAFIIAAGAGTVVFFHAERRRIKHPSAWASFVFLFLIVGLPAYALHVRRIRRSRR